MYAPAPSTYGAEAGFQGHVCPFSLPYGVEPGGITFTVW